MKELAIAGGSYLQHLFETPAADLPSVAGHSLGTMARSAALCNRAYILNEVAVLVRRLLDDCWAKDPAAIEEILAGHTINAKQEKVPQQRMVDSIRQLTRGWSDGARTHAKHHMDMYKATSEGGYRVNALLVLRLSHLFQESEFPPTWQTKLPMLNGLTKQLTAHGGVVGEQIAECINRDIRNANAHEEWEFDEGTGDIVIKSGQRFSLSDLSYEYAGLRAQ
jgi:hypothetical protein